MLSSWLSLDRKHQADSSSQVALFPAFLPSARNIPFTLRIPMALEAGRRCVFRRHQAEDRFSVHHGRLRIFLPFGVPRVGKHLQHLELKLVRLVSSESVVDSRQLQPDAGFLIELFSRLTSIPDGEKRFQSQHPL